MNYIKLIFDLKETDEGDIITAFLSELNPQGFEQNELKLFAFFNEDEYDDILIKTALQPLHIQFEKLIIPHENWNAQWESNFEPIRINNELGIRANFHPPFTDCKYDIEITPKMSFGTGHHETTQMMLEYACATDFNGKDVFDFGCGTGVLAILASLKGAKTVIGIDNDPWSVENAKENCMKNNCSSIEISIQDLTQINKQFDIILANINLNILLETLPILKNLLRSQGQIYLSGILYSDIPTMSKCFTELGFQLVSSKQKKDWVALHIN